MSNFKWENKNNKGAEQGRSFSGTIGGEKKTISDIRYSINVPTFGSLNDFCAEIQGLTEQAGINLLSLVNVAISNSYMNKAVELIARDIPVEDFTLEAFFTMSGNREGVGKAIEQAEELLVTLASEKMEVLAGINNILSDVISGKVAMADAPEIQKEMQGKVAGIDSQIQEVKERIAKLEVIKAEQAEKNKARGLQAAASRKANKEEKVEVKELSAKG